MPTREITSIDVGDYIVRQQPALLGVSAVVTAMALNKLVYIAHGLYLAKRGQPLFVGEVQAWRYGPVVPELFYAWRDFGMEPIPFDSAPDSLLLSNDKGRSDCVDMVIRVYGKVSAESLSRLTHANGTPWHVTWGNRVFNNEVIPNKVIQAYYETQLQEVAL